MLRKKEYPNKKYYNQFRNLKNPEGGLYLTQIRYIEIL